MQTSSCDGKKDHLLCGRGFILSRSYLIQSVYGTAGLYVVCMGVASRVFRLIWSYGETAEHQNFLGHVFNQIFNLSERRLFSLFSLPHTHTHTHTRTHTHTPNTQKTATKRPVGLLYLSPTSHLSLWWIGHIWCFPQGHRPLCVLANSSCLLLLNLSSVLDFLFFHQRQRTWILRGVPRESSEMYPKGCKIQPQLFSHVSDLADTRRRRKRTRSEREIRLFLSWKMLHGCSLPNRLSSSGWKTNEKPTGCDSSYSLLGPPGAWALG